MAELVVRHSPQRYGRRMRSRALGRLIVRLYSRSAVGRILLRLAIRVEGGEMYSLSLRAILLRYYGVEVGEYSYGSLLEPGRADQFTRIGRYVSIGPGVRRFGASHPMDRPSMHPFWYNPALGLVDPDQDVVRSSCEIGADSWIGANVTILPGCKRIGIGAVVGAGSVVTKDVADFAVVVGNPGRVIAQRLESEARRGLLESEPWNLEPEEARALYLEMLGQT